MANIDHEYRHVLVDTSVLLPAFCPVAHRSEAVCQRAKSFFDACYGNKWPSVRLASPTLCISEAINALDKMRYCEWYGGEDLRRKKLSKIDHASYHSKLNELLVRQEFTTIDLGRDTVAASGLVSPVNQKYQFRRQSKKSKKKKIKPPMGAADCMVIATGIIFTMRVSPSPVFLVTADQRMSDVLKKARQLTKPMAEQLGLLKRAKRCGLVWTPDIYPKPLNLMTATNAELRAAFSAWPLPTKKTKAVLPCDLSDKQKDQVIYLYLRINSKTKISIDKLPYSPEINQLRANIARYYGLKMTNEQIFHGLQSWRKSKYINIFREERLESFPHPSVRKENR